MEINMQNNDLLRLEPIEEDIWFGDEGIIDDESLIAGIPPEERILRTQAYDKSVSDVISMINAQDIILNPDYQRNYIWDNKKASLLIESFLLNVPIPVIYMSENDDSSWSVVDGLQRLESLRRFFANEFKLRGLEVLQELNGTQYSTLNPKAARILRNGILRIILIFKESHPDIKYEIFIRLNRGSIRLTEQELRNCLYRGNFNELLKELRENHEFLSMIGLSKPHKRMNDAELILRYFTVSDSFDFKANRLMGSYLGKVVSSMNKYINTKKNITAKEVESLRQRFQTTVDKVYAVFGADAFKKINPDGSLERRINRAVMDMIMVSFEHIDKNKLVAHKDEIISLLRNLPQQDVEFNEALTIGTSDKKQVEYRLSTWSRKLNEVLS
jgi:hypothetical protein